MVKKIMSAHKVISEYKRGKRDFSNISMKGMDFTNATLKGAIFKNSDCSYCYFDGADLSDTDFSGADLKWSGFRSTNFKNAKFIGADISFSAFHNAHFENTDMSKADLNSSLFFGANFSQVKKDGANLYNIAEHESQLTKAGIEEAQRVLNMLRTKLPFDFIQNLLLAISDAKTKFELSSGDRFEIDDPDGKSYVSVKPLDESRIQLEEYAKGQETVYESLDFSSDKYKDKKHDRYKKD